MNIRDIDPHLIEPQRLAGSVQDTIIIERSQRGYSGRAISTREALQALTYEANFVAVAALNLRWCKAQSKCGCTILADSDIDRLLIAKNAIDGITAEAVS